MKVFSGDLPIRIEMEKDRIAKSVYVEEYAGSRSVGRPRKRWIDTEGLFKEKRLGCQASKENSAEYD